METPESATSSCTSSRSHLLGNSTDIESLIHRGKEGFGVNSFPDSSSSNISSHAAERIDGNEDAIAESSLFLSVTYGNMHKMPDDETMRDDVANQNNEAQQRPGTMGYQVAPEKPAELQSNLDITKDNREQKHEIMEPTNKSDALQASNEKINALKSENTRLRLQNAFLHDGYYTMRLQNEQQRKDFQQVLQYLENEGQRQRIVQLSSQYEQLLLSFGKNMQKMVDVETMRDSLAKQNTELQHRADALERALQLSQEKRTRLHFELDKKNEENWLSRDTIKELTDNKKMEQDSLKCQAGENNENSLKMAYAEMMNGFLEKHNELQQRADKFKRKYQLAHEKTKKLQAELGQGKERNKQQCNEIKKLIMICKKFKDLHMENLERISILETIQLTLNGEKSELNQLLESAAEELEQCRKELDDIKMRKGHRTTFMSRIRRCLSRVKVPFSKDRPEPRIFQPIDRPGQCIPVPAVDCSERLEVPLKDVFEKLLGHYCSQEDDLKIKLPVCNNITEARPFVPLKKICFEVGQSADI